MQWDTIYPKLSQFTKPLKRGKLKSYCSEGFTPADFPYNPPYTDGSCYFAGPNDRSIAEELNESYKDGIIEVSIDRESYDIAVLILV